MKLPMFACAVFASTVAGAMAWLGWQAVVTPALIVITVCVDEICDALKDTK